MNTANKLTVFRIILIPIFIYMFFSSFPYSNIISLFIYILAGITDFLDGFIARKYNMQTKAGTVLDPLADKLMLISVLTSLYIKKLIPLWVLIIVIAKEVIMIIVGIILYNKNFIIPSNIFGKLSTIIFYIAICLLILSVNEAIWVIYVALTLSILAFIIYFLIFSKMTKNKKDL